MSALSSSGGTGLEGPVEGDRTCVARDSTIPFRRLRRVISMREGRSGAGVRLLGKGLEFSARLALSSRSPFACLPFPFVLPFPLSSSSVWMDLAVGGGGNEGDAAPVGA